MRDVNLSDIKYYSVPYLSRYNVHKIMEDFDGIMARTTDKKGNPHEFRPVQLVWLDGEKVYAVWRDGNHRVMAAKKLKVNLSGRETIYANVFVPVVPISRTSSRKTGSHYITSFEMYQAAADYPNLAEEFSKLGDMLSILEDYLAKSGKKTGPPYAVAERRSNEGVIWHLDSDTIHSVLQDSYSLQDRKLLISQITIHENHYSDTEGVRAQAAALRIPQIRLFIRNQFRIMAGILGMSMDDPQIVNRLDVVEKALQKIYEGFLAPHHIDPYAHIRTLETDATAPAVDKELCVAVNATAGNTLHWDHLIIGLLAIAELGTDKVIFDIQSGKDTRKPILAFTEKFRYELTQEEIEMFEPFFVFSVNTSVDGETDIRRILKLNPLQKIVIFYIAGGDHYHRWARIKGLTDDEQPSDNWLKGDSKYTECVDRIKRDHPIEYAKAMATVRESYPEYDLPPDTIQKLEDISLGLDNPNHYIIAVFIERGESLEHKRVRTSLDVRFLPEVGDAAATNIREALAGKRDRSDLIILPYMGYHYINEHPEYLDMLINPEKYQELASTQTAPAADASSRGLPRALVNLLVLITQRISRLSISKWGVIKTNSAQIKKAAVVLGKVGERDVIKNLVAAGVVFVRAPPAWRFGVANYTAKDGTKYVIVPQNVSAEEIAHEIWAVLHSDKSHNDNPIKIDHKQTQTPTVAGKSASKVASKGVQPLLQRMITGTFAATLKKAVYYALGIGFIVVLVKGLIPFSLPYLKASTTVSLLNIHIIPTLLLIAGIAVGLAIVNKLLSSRTAILNSSFIPVGKGIVAYAAGIVLSAFVLKLVLAATSISGAIIAPAFIGLGLMAGILFIIILKSHRNKLPAVEKRRSLKDQLNSEINKQCKNLSPEDRRRHLAELASQILL